MQQERLVTGIVVLLVLAAIALILRLPPENSVVNDPAKSPADVAFSFADYALPADATRMSRGPSKMTLAPISRSSARCIITPKILQHTVDAIANTELQTNPFPHIYVQNVFQPQFYKDCILDRLPQPNITAKVYKRLEQGNNRFQLEMRRGQGIGYTVRNSKNERVFRPANPSLVDVEFWNGFINNYTKTSVVKSLINKFSRTLARRDKNFMDHMDDFDFHMDLGRDLAGYEIGPHTDSVAKWVTALFYLPATSNYPHFGTLVMRSQIEETGTKRFKMGSKGFKTATQAKYIPNMMLAFPPCATSWHAVPFVKSAGVIQRDTIQGFIRNRHYGFNTPKTTC